MATRTLDQIARLRRYRDELAEELERAPAWKTKTAWALDRRSQVERVEQQLRQLAARN